MERLAILAQLKAKPGKEQDAEASLKSEQPVAGSSPRTCLDVLEKRRSSAQRRPVAALLVAIFSFLFPLAISSSAVGQADRGLEVATSRRLQVGGAELQVDFASGEIDLPIDTVLAHVRSAALAVSTYFGRFPVNRARVLLIPVPGRSGILQGTTWGDRFGFPAFTRIRIGQHTTTADLATDWIMTHELVHMAFPSLPHDQHWMEEGMATYVEPIARVEIGELRATQIWGDMMRDMSQGEPAADDQGLNHTHTWGRTYWGGAMFCLVADVEIRRETGNRKGLRDAFRAIVAGGGTIDHDWDLQQALEIGDRATGTHVLTEMYAKWKDSPVQVDLGRLWKQLGIRSTANGIEFTADAPLAKVREAIAGDSPPAGRPLQPHSP